jgi:hypothetical protein
MVGHSGYVASAKSPRQQLLERVDTGVAALLTTGAPVVLSAADRAALVAALPAAADVAAHLDYDRLAAAIAAHIHVG